MTESVGWDRAGLVTGDGGAGSGCDDWAAGAEWIVGVGGIGTGQLDMSGVGGNAGLGSRDEPLPKSLRRPLFLLRSVGRLGVAGVAGGDGGK